MSYELDLAKAIWQTVVMFSTMVIFILAFLRYREKKSDVSKTLLITFLMFFVAMIFQIWGTWGSMNGITYGSYLFGEPDFILNWIQQLIFQSQMAYFLLILGLLSLFKFAFQLTQRENEPIKYLFFAQIFAAILILWGIFRLQLNITTEDSLLQFITMIDPYVVIFGLLMTIPIIRQGLILLKKIPKDDPMIPKIRDMTKMGIYIFIMVLFFIIETVWGLVSNEWTNPFSFLGFGFALIGLISGYLSFYKR